MTTSMTFGGTIVIVLSSKYTLKHFLYDSMGIIYPCRHSGLTKKEGGVHQPIQCRLDDELSSND